MKIIKSLATISVLIVSQTCVGSGLNYESVWKCDRDKWNWYCDIETQPPTTESSPQKKQPLKKERAVDSKSAREIKDITTAEELRAELKRREDLAIMNPTPANVRSYLEMNAYMQTKASDFADSWRRVVWQNPDLDYAQKRPVNNSANRTFIDERDKRVDDHLKALAQEHGIIFFYRSDCPYCHSMSPVLQDMVKKYGFDVLAVATDGRALTNWPAPFRSNEGQFESLLKQHGIQEPRVPAIFIASKRTGETAPIGMGVMANTELIDRIFVLTGTKVGDEF